MDLDTENMRNLVSHGTRRNWDKNMPYSTVQYESLDARDLLVCSEIAKPARLPRAEGADTVCGPGNTTSCVSVLTLTLLICTESYANNHSHFHSLCRSSIRSTSTGSTSGLHIMGSPCGIQTLFRVSTTRSRSAMLATYLKALSSACSLSRFLGTTSQIKHLENHIATILCASMISLFAARTLAKLTITPVGCRERKTLVIRRLGHPISES